MQKEERMCEIHLPGGRSQNARVIHHARVAATSTEAPSASNPTPHPFISIRTVFFELASFSCCPQSLNPSTACCVSAPVGGQSCQVHSSSSIISDNCKSNLQMPAMPLSKRCQLTWDANMGRKAEKQHPTFITV